MRNEILSANARRYTTVKVPFVGEVRLQSLTEGERNAVEMKQYTEKGQRDPKQAPYGKVNWIIAAAVDEHGSRLFADGDRETLCKVDSVVTDTMFEAILEHVGLTAQDRAKILKNCEPAVSDDSPTA